MNDAETEFKAKQLWDKMSKDDKLKILSDYNVWNGFNQYLWEYIPEYLKELIVAKIISNCV